MAHTRPLGTALQRVLGTIGQQALLTPSNLDPSSIFHASDDVHKHTLLMALGNILKERASEYAIAQDPRPTQDCLEGWSNLPGEIKESVLRWVGRRDLRSCRLVDRETGSAATGLLFHTVCLSPSTSSVDRLIMISLDPTLAGLVQKIEVHTHYLIDFPFEQMLDDGPLAQRLQGLQPLRAASEALRLLSAYKSELSCQTAFLTQGPTQLQQVLKRFTQLRHFAHVRPSAQTAVGSYRLDHDSDLGERTGVYLLDDEKQYPLMNSVLQKIGHLRPVSLDLTSLYWWEFYNISEIPHLGDLLSRVTTFKLTFHVASFTRVQSCLNAKCRYWNMGLSTFLKRLSSYLTEVGDLTLGFDRLPSMLQRRIGSDQTYALDRMTGLLLQTTSSGPSYPKLRSLALENVATTFNAFEAFLLPHASTLKSLTIRNMHIDGRRPDGNEGILGSMLAIMGLLDVDLELESMSFRGVLEDHVGKSLECDEAGGLFRRIEGFICHR